MSITGWILFGFIVGLIARVLMPGRDPLGLIGTVVLGIVGALCAGWVGQALGLYPAGNGAGFVAATLGAIVVLAIYYGFAGRRRLAATRANPRPEKSPGISSDASVRPSADKTKKSA